MTATRPVFVLIHGSSHNRTAWERVTPILHMITAVDGTIGGRTTLHTLESSHSPFLSQPASVSKILIDIGLDT